MAAPDRYDFNTDRGERAVAHPRAVGSPLPRGDSGSTANPMPVAPWQMREPEPLSQPLPPSAAQHALTDGAGPAHSDDMPQHRRGLQRAMSMFKAAIPIVQKLLPLLDGNIATAVANVMPRPAQPPVPTQPPATISVDLAPIQNSVAELRVQHRELSDQLHEQTDSIRKVEDQLSMVREATDRNTLEQQELMEDLKSVGKKVNMVALVALGLLAVSVLLNLILYLHIQRVLP